MAQGQPTSPMEDRPWYYQNWFLFATFIMGWPIVGPPFGVLWPVWALLILRSPWHSHTLLKGLGWAMLAVGAYMFTEVISSGSDTAGRAVATLIPGLLVTVITQRMWSRYRLEHGLGGSGPAPLASPRLDSSASSRRSRPRRRAQRRRGSRPGRSSREM